jgi:hypothetical protein
VNFGGVFYFYFFSGPRSPLNVVDQCITLIGKPAAMPYWAFGMILHFHFIHFFFYIFDYIFVIQDIIVSDFDFCDIALFVNC